MDVEELLRKAWAAVEKAGVPESVQEEAFRQAVDHLRAEESSGQSDRRSKVDTEKGGRRQKRAPQTTDRPPAASVDVESMLEGVSSHTGVDLADLSTLYYDENGAVGIGLPGSALGSNKKARVETISYLLAGAYRVGLGQSINAEAVRAAVKKVGAFDRNFSAYVRSLSAHITVSGPKKSKTFDLKPQGEDEFTKVVKRVLGQDDRAQ